MYALISTALYILDLYWWIVIAAVIMSWLINYGVVNRHNRVAMTVADVLYRLTEPVLRPIRRILPNLGGIDLSPMVLLIILFFLEQFIGRDLYTLVSRYY